MLKDLVKQNRSYRGFDENVKISREMLLELIDFARICPSAMNAQPLKYYLAPSGQDVAKIQPLTIWARKLASLNLPREGHRPTAFIVICADKNIKNPSTVGIDVGIAAQTIMLAAVEKGLGGCMIESFDHTGVAQALSLPENLAPVLVLALGKPDETVVLTDAQGDISYYRDEKDVHYVPKRKREDIVLP